MKPVEQAEDVIHSNSSLEDQWYYASQKENREYTDWQLLYRMKDSLFSELVDEALSNDDVKTISSAERIVRQSKQWKQYMQDMVNTEGEYRRRKTNTEYIKMKYFENKSSEKAENEAYFHKQPDSDDVFGNYSPNNKNTNPNNIPGGML